MITAATRIVHPGPYSPGDEVNGSVKMKLAISMPREPGPEMKPANTEGIVIIGWCSRDGHMTWA
jgi:hypothetical protein